VHIKLVLCLKIVFYSGGGGGGGGRGRVGFQCKGGFEHYCNQK